MTQRLRVSRGRVASSFSMHPLGHATVGVVGAQCLALGCDSQPSTFTTDAYIYLVLTICVMQARSLACFA